MITRISGSSGGVQTVKLTDEDAAKQDAHRVTVEALAKTSADFTRMLSVQFQEQFNTTVTIGDLDHANYG